MYILYLYILCPMLYIHYVHHILVHSPTGDMTVDHMVQRRNIGIRADDKVKDLQDASFTRKK